MDRRMPVPDEEATAPRELADLVSSTSDELEEPTNIIQSGSAKAAEIDAFIRGRLAQEGARPAEAPPAETSEPAAPAARGPQAAGYSDILDGPTIRRSGRAQPAAQATQATHAAQAAAEARPAEAQEAPVEKPAEARPHRALVTAVRVAVVRSDAGDVRLIALGQDEQPPTGSAVGILVPSSEGDGASMARFLGLAP
jgi:hypothetical protein